MLPLLTLLALLAAAAAPAASAASAAPAAPAFVPPLPSAKQLPYLSMRRLAAFVHFGITTFLPATQDNNCVSLPNGTTQPLAPLSLFDPPTAAPIDTDDWLRAVVAAGATQACLTAHHSGGFALWPSRVKNYTIAHTPYAARFPGADLVRQFVASCRKFSVSPCLYIAPQVDCDLARGPRAAYLPAMLGMLGELLRDYGAIDRLWLDTAWVPVDATQGGSLGTQPWRDIMAFITDASPATATFPGADGCEVNSDYGYGRADFCTANVLPPLALDAQLPNRALAVSENCWTATGGTGVNTSEIYAGPPQPVYFKPGEDMATMQRNGNWFMHIDSAPEAVAPQALASQLAATVLRGQGFIVNIPPNASGVVPGEFAAAAAALGGALQALRGRAIAASPAHAPSTPCPGLLTLPLPPGACFNALALVEDLAAGGQAVANYSVSLAVAGRVPETAALPPARVPGPYFGQWEGRGGGTIGAGVLDLLSGGAPVCGALRVTVALTGCFAPSAAVTVEARLVNVSSLGPVPEW